MELKDAKIVYIGKKSRVLSDIYKLLPKGIILSFREAYKIKKDLYNKCIVFFSLPYKGSEHEYYEFIDRINYRVFINISSTCVLRVPDSSARLVGSFYQKNKIKLHNKIINKKNAINIICGKIVNKGYINSNKDLGSHSITFHSDLINEIESILNNYKEEDVENDRFCFRIIGIDTHQSNIIRLTRSTINKLNWRFTALFDIILKLLGVSNRFYTYEANSLCFQSLKLENHYLIPENRNGAAAILDNNISNNLNIIKRYISSNKYEIISFKYNPNQEIFIVSVYSKSEKLNVQFFSNKLILNYSNERIKQLLDNSKINNDVIRKLLLDKKIIFYN